MKFIINVFDKELIYKLAFHLRGEIVNPKEYLVIAFAEDEMKLSEKIKDILQTDVFDISEQTVGPYSTMDLSKLINWSELSRFITKGDRNSIRPKYIPKKHYEALDKLFNEELPAWWSGQKS